MLLRVGGRAGCLFAVGALGADSADWPTDAIDHAALIRSWGAASFERGEKLYSTLCVTCHGTPEQPGTLPTSRAFWREPLQNGSEPLNLYRTLRDGLGQMPAWTFLTPEQCYDVIHYVRETFLKPHNPGAYFEVTPAYLASLPQPRAGALRPTVEKFPFQPGSKHLGMDFGPALFWTLEVEPGNIAYKGIAVRLDEGPGGVSKGRAWMLYDHDTLRVAAAWSGEGFVDWKGIAFDGSHQTHTSLVGRRAFTNPVGPGWANPVTHSFDDPRFRGRDGKPYGPLPRDWARFRGVYLHGHRVVLAYTVGDASVLEHPGVQPHGSGLIYSRTLNVGKASHDLRLRVAWQHVPVAVVGETAVRLEPREGFHVLQIPASATPLNLKVVIASPEAGLDFAALRTLAATLEPAADLTPLTRGGPPRWTPPIATRGQLGSEAGPFAVDELTAPSAEQMPWHSWMRFGGFDFFQDGERAAICTWNGDVWLVQGIMGNLEQLIWKRIATGLFQPLGLKIAEEVIHVACRDQIARLRDLNGDDEIDFIECFNNDHQVTEHFHEFAMGLQTDPAGNFYYAKSARHALPALVPHHGALLKVSGDGTRTEIVATGFRAANGVCVNDDGTFFVTDQEGHWHPKNRINWVRPGRFYGNMFAYHDAPSAGDADMEPPLVWITNEMDRSPGELLRVPSAHWGPLQGALLNLSYGTGRIFVVPHERFGDQMQGGVVRLPVGDFPTGVMRGRFHPGNGQLYACGLYAWAANQMRDGGFFRVRYTGKPVRVPIGLQAGRRGLLLRFTDPLDRAAASDPRHYVVKVWSLRRSEQYGSPHLNERSLAVRRAQLSADGKTVLLEIEALQPTWCMEIRYSLRGADGTPVEERIHNTIHTLGPE